MSGNIFEFIKLIGMVIATILVFAAAAVLIVTTVTFLIPHPTPVIFPS